MYIFGIINKNYYLCALKKLKTKQTMIGKRARIAAIRDIIQTQCISSQEDLLSILTTRGIETTQATLSRDLKQMQITKVATREGNYMYVMPDAVAPVTTTAHPRYIPTHLVHGVVSVECSQILCVLRTKPGNASSVAYDIDVRQLKEVMGTIAGDDTILVIPRTGFTPEQVAEAICN